MAHDISILCSADAQAWAEFLERKLSGENYACSVRVTSVQVEAGEVAGEVVDEHRSAHVQVLMVSPDFVEPVVQAESPEDLPDFIRLFPKPSKSVAVFCGCDVADGEVTQVISGHFKNFHKWAKCSAGQGEGEVNRVLVTILQVLEQDINNGTDSGIPEEDIYSYPPPPRSVGKRAVRVVPDRLTMVGEQLYLLFDEAVSQPVAVQCQKDLSKEVVAVEENSHTFSFTLPPEWRTSKSSLDLSVFCNDQSMGTVTVQFETKLDTISRLLKDVMNPLEVLATALGIRHSTVSPWDASALDLKLKQVLQSNCPAGNFQSVFDVSSHAVSLGTKTDKVTPTVLHFAAKFGLKELCAELLTCPGAAQAFTVENIDGLLPNDMAAEEGHEDLATFLTDYMYTGVPIAMVYNEMKKKDESSANKGAPEELPPQPCPGGNYVDVPKGNPNTQSIYIDMGSRGSTASNLPIDTYASPRSISPRVSHLQVKPDQSPRPRSKSPQTTSHQAPSPKPKPKPLQTPSHPASGRSDKASSSPSPASSVADRYTEDPRRHSDSDVSSTGSRGSPGEREDSDPEIPAPFSPAPLTTAREISRVSVTSMSPKDKALRNIIQSAADGSVSMDEAKHLVDKWQEQYQKSQSSFHGKWSAIKEFQTSALEEEKDQGGAAVKPRKSFLSKMFKRKTKSVSEIPTEKSRAKSKKAGRHGASRSQLSEATDLRVRNELVSSLSTGSVFQRKNSMRVSHAMQDKDLTDLPDVPRRSFRHSRFYVAEPVRPPRPAIPTNLPLIKSNTTTPSIVKGKNSSEASPPEGAGSSLRDSSVRTQQSYQSMSMLGAELSPRLPDPDRVPTSK